MTSSNRIESYLTQLDRALWVLPVSHRSDGLSLKGVNGKIEVEGIESSTEIDLVNGKVDFSPNYKQVYRYDVAVKNGKMDKFETSNDPKALAVRINVINGVISNEE